MGAITSTHVVTVLLDPFHWVALRDRPTWRALHELREFPIALDRFARAHQT